LGAAVAEIVVQNKPVPMKIIGIPDENTVIGSSEEIFRYYGITKENLVKIAKEMIHKLNQLQ
jgi:transketolase